MDNFGSGTQRLITVVGHRGARGHAPENTLRSFATAIAHGVSAGGDGRPPEQGSGVRHGRRGPRPGTPAHLPRSSILSPALIARAHATGLLVYMYHVNTAEAAADAIRWGADDIGTDYPDLVFTSYQAAEPGPSAVTQSSAGYPDGSGARRSTGCTAPSKVEGLRRTSNRILGPVGFLINGVCSLPVFAA